MKKNIFDKAEKDYDKTLKLHDSCDNFVERGDFLAKHEKYKDSIKDYTAAIALNNQNAEIYKQRGYIYQKLKKDKEAEADFEQALKLNPSADVPLEKKIIAQQEEQQTKDQQPSQQEYSQVKQETPLNSENTKGKDNSNPTVQTNIELIKNESKETTVQSEKPQSSEQQTQPIKEQNIGTPTITPAAATPSETVQPKQEATKAPQATTLTPTEENNKEKPKKAGFFSKLFKKSKKENSADNNELSTNVPSLHPNDIETEYNRANINYKNKKI
jgi:tetratricopeptide (TPR) repeat protein